MAMKFDDFLSKKKEPAQVLDLSRVKITTKEEFKKYMDKIPEYKIKPEKVMPESIKIRDKDFSFVPSRREGRVTEYNYADPTPPDMKGVHLADLCPVSIDWKMLTTLRPKTKIEEDMFSRLVQLGKLDLKYQAMVKRSKDTDWVRKTKNPRSSIVETRVLSCKECGEDFCDGFLCSKLTYENFFRIQPSLATGVVKGAEGAGDDTEKKSRKKRRRGRRRTRTVRQRKPRKNSIFNRPASRGCSRDHSRRERVAASMIAQRSASQDRARPPTRRTSRSPAQRAKSAPRIHFKGLSSDEEGAVRKSGYTSESAVSHSDYSTQSESESPERPSGGKTASGDESSSRRAFIRHCTLNESQEPLEPVRRPRPFTAGEWNWRDRGDTTSDNSDTSPSPDRPARRRPATIQLEFHLSSSQALPQPILRQRRYAPSAKSKEFARQQEIQQLVQGLSRVELAFDDEDVVDRPAKTRRRQRLQRSAAIKSEPSKKPSAFLQGKALFSKSVEDAVSK